MANLKTFDPTLRPDPLWGIDDADLSEIQVDLEDEEDEADEEDLDVDDEDEEVEDDDDSLIHVNGSRNRN